MNGVRWKMVHVIEMSPAWLESEPEESDESRRSMRRARLSNEALARISESLGKAGCTLESYELRPEFYIDRDGRTKKQEFRLRFDIHTERKDAGIDFERLAARLCADINLIESGEK